MSFSIRVLNRLRTGFSTTVSEFLSDATQIKGAIRSKGNPISHAEFVELCQKTLIDDIPSLWQDLSLTGQFSAFIETSTHWILAVDPIRSYPLYYWLSGTTFTVTDAVLPDDRTPEPAFSPEFLWFGFVSGADTLYKGVKQLLAGQCLLINRSTGQIQSFFYAQHKAPQEWLTSAPEAFEALKHYDDALWARFIEDVGDRPIWIPLSAGYDGRYILAALLQRGLKSQLRCYTYGRPNSFEIAMAKRVCEQCDVPWTPVFFDNTTWRCFPEADSQEFLMHAFSGSAVPQWMEWVAFRQLLATTTVELNAVIVPGHSGDFLGGSHLRSELGSVKTEYGSSDAISSLFRHHGRLISPVSDEKNAIQIHLLAQYPQLAFWDAFSFTGLVESWNVINRQAKFIGNACQAYSWFGYDWKLPLLDFEFCQFWYQLPRSLRWNSRLYHQFLFETYFFPMGIDFQPPVTFTKKGSLALLKQHAPQAVYNGLKNWAKDMRRNTVDFNGWQWLNDELLRHIDTPTPYRNREDHALLAKWLVQKTVL